MGALHHAREAPTIPRQGLSYTMSAAVESTPNAVPQDYQGATGRSGVYDVTVTKTGYLPWTREDVRVDQCCHCRTASLTAELQPQ